MTEHEVVELLTESYSPSTGLPIEIKKAEVGDIRIKKLTANKLSTNVLFYLAVKGYKKGTVVNVYLLIKMADHTYDKAGAIQYQGSITLENFLLEQGKSICVSQDGLSTTDISMEWSYEL